MFIPSWISNEVKTEWLSETAILTYKKFKNKPEIATQSNAWVIICSYHIEFSYSFTKGLETEDREALWLMLTETQKWHV